ncbi:hypothetical protein THAOC_11734, partial [Thalassiosira oceanica]
MLIAFSVNPREAAGGRPLKSNKESLHDSLVRSYKKAGFTIDRFGSLKDWYWDFLNPTFVNELIASLKDNSKPIPRRSNPGSQYTYHSRYSRHDIQTAVERNRTGMHANTAPLNGPLELHECAADARYDELQRWLLSGLAAIDHQYRRRIDVRPSPSMSATGGMHRRWIRACMGEEIRPEVELFPLLELQRLSTVVRCRSLRASGSGISSGSRDPGGTSGDPAPVPSEVAARVVSGSAVLHDFLIEDEKSSVGAALRQQRSFLLLEGAGPAVRSNRSQTRQTQSDRFKAQGKLR